MAKKVIIHGSPKPGGRPAPPKPGGGSNKPGGRPTKK